VHVVNQQLPLVGQIVQVEAERTDVLGQLFGGLLESHEDAGLSELRSAAD